MNTARKDEVLGGDFSPTPTVAAIREWGCLEGHLLSCGLFEDVSPKHGTHHILRSDASGLTLYIRATQERSRFRGPICTLVYEAEVDHCAHLQQQILESDRIGMLETTISLIWKCKDQLLSWLQSHPGYYESVPTSALVAEIENSVMKRELLDHLQQANGGTIPENSYEGIINAINSLIDDWLLSHHPQQALDLK